MPKKQFFIGANWKMNPAPTGALQKDTPFHSNGAPQIVVFPSFLDFEECMKAGVFSVGAQYGRGEKNGAFTGDISMSMLKDLGCMYVLCGHSERRQHHQENDDVVALQVKSALEQGMTAVLCIGENADQYEMSETEDVLREQLLPVLDACGKNMTPENLIVAYEPVWAIGSGKTPDTKTIEKTHAFIRSLLPKKDIRIIYGGSVTPKNAASIFAEKNVDGALVGGCSLKLDEFQAIVDAAK